MAKAHVYHTTPPGGQGLQDFGDNSVGALFRRAQVRGQVHLFQRRRPDGGLDYLWIKATSRGHRFIERIARHG